MFSGVEGMSDVTAAVVTKDRTKTIAEQWKYCFHEGMGTLALWLIQGNVIKLTWGGDISR